MVSLKVLGADEASLDTGFTDDSLMIVVLEILDKLIHWILGVDHLVDRIKNQSLLDQSDNDLVFT